MDQLIKITKGVSLYLLAFAIFFLGFNHYYVNSILDTSSLIVRETQFEEYKEETIILMMGDSILASALDTQVINNSFNFGIPGETYTQTNLKLKRLLEDPSFKPKIIVLPINMHSFSSYRQDRLQDGWYWKKYATIKELKQDSKNAEILKEVIYANFPSISNAERLLSYAKGNENIFMVKGYVPTQGEFTYIVDKRNAAAQKALLQFKDANALNEQYLSSLNEIISLSNEHNISVVLVKFPLTDVFLTESEKYIPNREAFYKSVYAHINKNASITILDFQEEYPSNYSLFVDSIHLNVNGAAIFSPQINEKLQSMLMEKMRSNLSG